MRSAYIAVTIVAAIAYAYAAVMNVRHEKSVTETCERLGLPVSWQIPLGTVLGAGAAGLAIGLAIPVVGTAAGCGLVLYFICAAGFHVRARDTLISAWCSWFAFFALAAAALAVGLTYHGPA
jgi:hypothetical protein